MCLLSDGDSPSMLLTSYSTLLPKWRVRDPLVLCLSAVVFVWWYVNASVSLVFMLQTTLHLLYFFRTRYDFANNFQYRI